METFTIVLAVAQGLMDIIVALGMFILVGMRTDLKSNTEVISQLRTDVKDYLPRREFEAKVVLLEALIETRWQDTRDRVHEIGNRVSEVVTLARWADEDRRKRTNPPHDT